MSSILKSTSSSSPTSDSTGGAYTRKLFFYSEVDLPKGKEFSMTNEELGKKLKDGKLGELMLDDKEKIEKMSIYTHPLNWWQIWKGVMHHAFIVFETKDWYWSIEKNDAGVTVQRSKFEKSVRDKCGGQKRQEGLTTGIAMEKSKNITNKTVKQFFEHVYEANYINEEYHFLEKNCQEFADKIYNFF